MYDSWPYPRLARQKRLPRGYVPAGHVYNNLLPMQGPVKPAKAKPRRIANGPLFVFRVFNRRKYVHVIAATTPEAKAEACRIRGWKEHEIGCIYTI